MVKKVKPPSINKRLKHLEEGIERLDRWMEIQDKQITDLKNEREDDREYVGAIDEKTTEAKKEIVTFTFELISMIIGFLSLLLAIVILWINQTQINTQMEWILVALGIAFVFLFAGFVLSWRKKHFPKIEGISYDKIISYIDTKISEMVDYIESNNSDMRSYIDSKISDVGDLIKSNNSKMRDYIEGEISKCCKYTDEKMSEVAEFIKDKNKTK